jgi:hypothetical protein
MDVYKQLDLRVGKCKFNLKLIHKVNSHCNECKPNDYVNKKTFWYNTKVQIKLIILNRHIMMIRWPLRFVKDHTPIYSNDLMNFILKISMNVST